MAVPWQLEPCPLIHTYLQPRCPVPSCPRPDPSVAGALCAPCPGTSKGALSHPPHTPSQWPSCCASSGPLPRCQCPVPSPTLPQWLVHVLLPLSQAGCLHRVAGRQDQGGLRSPASWSNLMHHRIADTLASPWHPALVSALHTHTHECVQGQNVAGSCSESALTLARCCGSRKHWGGGGNIFPLWGTSPYPCPPNSTTPD